MRVNLEEILRENLKTIPYAMLTLGDTGSLENVLNAMRKACNQAIHLCAENADYYVNDGADLHGVSIDIDKESILETKKQIV